MNNIIGGCLILLCTGCVSVTGVVPVGKDKYTVSSEMVMNFPSWPQVKQLSLKHANLYCNGKGQYMEVVGWNLHGVRGWTPLNAERQDDNDKPKFPIRGMVVLGRSLHACH